MSMHGLSGRSGQPQQAAGDRAGTNTPFVMRDHRRVEGGLGLVFGCTTCGADAVLVLQDEDALQAEYPVECGCGSRVNMHFGSPMVARALLREIKRLPEGMEYDEACPN